MMQFKNRLALAASGCVPDFRATRMATWIVVKHCLHDAPCQPHNNRGFAQ
jgi:hypothetical protein